MFQIIKNKISDIYEYHFDFLILIIGFVLIDQSWGLEMPYKRVRPKSYEGNSLSWNLNLLSGPKFTIECGECGKMFEARVPRVDYPSVECPRCNADNVLNLIFE